MLFVSSIMGKTSAPRPVPGDRTLPVIHSYSSPTNMRESPSPRNGVLHRTNFSDVMFHPLAITLDSQTHDHHKGQSPVLKDIHVYPSSIGFDSRTRTLRGSLQVLLHGGLGPDGGVFIRYTEDAWRSYTDVSATRVLADENSDSFYFSIQLADGIDEVLDELKVEFAICCYHGTGVTHWENNRGYNFLAHILFGVRKPPLSRPRSFPENGLRESTLSSTINFGTSM